MSEKCDWIVFRAHPGEFVKKRDHHPDFSGIFVCPLLRTEPEQLLKELLANKKLLLTEVISTELKALHLDWGRNERLKAQMSLEGFGLALTKMHSRPIALS